MVMRTVFDPLTLFDDQGKVVPNLAKSVDHNADFTQWTLVRRDGITFHDGHTIRRCCIWLHLTSRMAAS